MGAFVWRGRARPLNEGTALERSWAAGLCDRCGATLILGEGIVVPGRQGKERLCFACASAPTVSAAAQSRSGECVVATLPLDDRLDEAA
jgi:hypothetical protein